MGLSRSSAGPSRPRPERLDQRGLSLDIPDGGHSCEDFGPRKLEQRGGGSSDPGHRYFLAV